MLRFNGPGSLFGLDSVLEILEDSTRQYILHHLKEADTEIQAEVQANRQLEADLQADIIRERRNGVETSLLYQKLPPEIRHHIYTYVVKTEHSVHVFPPRGNESHGYRLSLCEEGAYNWVHGHCQCENGRNVRPSVQSAFFDSAIFLTSRTVRREALDVFFTINQFTFTCLHEFIRFAHTFKQSVSKIQSLRLLEKLDDYPASDHKIRSIQRTRERMRNLKHLDLHLYISTWSAYEYLYEDGLLNELIHFAFGPPPAQPKLDRNNKPRCAGKGEELNTSTTVQASNTTKSNSAPVTGSTTVADAARATLRSLTANREELNRIPGLHKILGKRLIPDFNDPPEPIPTDTYPIQPLKSFTVTARPRGYRILPSEEEQFAALGARLEAKLTDIFMNTHRTTIDEEGTVKAPKYTRVEDVTPLQKIPPKQKTRDDELPLESKKGILFLKD